MSSRRILDAFDIRGLSTQLNPLPNPSAHYNEFDWTAYADAAGTAPVDGTGGTPSGNLNWSRSTTTPLKGDASFVLSKSGANAQGEGFSTPFTIPRAWQGRVLRVRLRHEYISGTYATGDLRFYIYDITNSRLIPIAPGELEHTLVPGLFQGSFQTSIDSTSYRFIVHVASTSAVAYSLRLDEFEITEQPVAQGTPNVDMAAYTATLTNLGTATQNLEWGRDGQFVIIKGRITIGATLPSGAIRISTPPGVSFADSLNIAAGTGTASKTSFPLGSIEIASSTTFGFLSQSANSAWNATNPFTWAAGDYFDVNLRAKVVGWSSQTQMSSETDTRVVAAKVNRATSAQNIANNTLTTLQFNNVFKDSHGGWDAANFRYRIPVSGTYVIHGYVETASTTATGVVVVYPLIDGSSRPNRATNTKSGTASGSLGVTYSFQIDLLAGQTVAISTLQITGGAIDYLSSASIEGGFVMNIERTGGPSQISPTESIAIAVNTATGTLASGDNPTVFTNKVLDTHGAYNASTGVFTVPATGLYQADGAVFLSGTFALDLRVNCNLQIDGTSVAGALQRAGGAVTNMGSGLCTFTRRLVTGQQIRLVAGTTATGPTYNPDTNVSYMNIKRIGI